MGCSEQWIISGQTKTIEETDIKMFWTQSNCATAVFSVWFPWGGTTTHALDEGESKEYANPSNKNETVTVTMVGTWCIENKDSAGFRVCYDKPETTGKIKCITSPSGATIYFNGKRMSNPTTTTLTNVPPNTWHTIKFEKDGFESISDQWYVEAGKTVVAEKILTPIRTEGYIKAISDLDNVTAKVMIDGSPVAHTVPYTFTVKEGRHTVTFTKANHIFIEVRATVEADKTVTVTGNPTPITERTVITLNSLPNSVVAGEEITLSGTLKDENGTPVLGQIKFYDKDTMSADDPLMQDGSHLTTMSNSTDGKFSIKWNTKSMDLLIGTDVIAKFEGTQLYNESESNVQHLDFVIVEKTVLTLNKIELPVMISEQIDLSGTLKTESGKAVPNVEISLWDADPTLDQPLKENNVKLVTTTNLNGEFTTKWTAVSMDSPEVTVDVKAKFGGNDDYRASVSDSQKIQLSVRKGELNVISDPVGAEIYINGEKKPQTTPQKYSVDLGEYEVKMVFPGFGEHIETSNVVFDKPTTVHHQFTTPHNMCTLLGYDVSDYECVERIAGLFTEFGTPLVEAGIIKDHVNPLTGDQEEPTNWTYLFFLLGSIPIVGTVGKPIGKAGLKLTTEGSTLTKLAKADPELSKVLVDNHAVVKLLSMTDDKMDEITNLAKNKDYDGIKGMLDEIDIVDMTPAKRAEIEQNVIKGVGADASDDVMKHLDDSFTASHFVSYGNPEFWETYFVKRLLDGEELVNGGLGQNIADMCLEVLDVGKSFPITKTKLFIDRLHEIGRYDELIEVLSKSGKVNANIMSDYFKLFENVVEGKGAFTDPEVYEAFLRKIGSITHDAMSAGDTAAMSKLSGVLLDSTGKLKPLNEIANHHWFKGILKIAPVDLFTKFSDMFMSITSGAKTTITRAEADEFLQMAIDFPATAKDVMKKVDETTILKLIGIGSPEAKSVASYAKAMDNIDTRFTEDVFASISSKSAAALKKILSDSPGAIDDILYASDDINYLIGELSGTTLKTIKTEFNLVNEIELLWKTIKASPMKTPLHVIAFIKSYMKGVWEWARRHPNLAMGTSVGIITMSLWYNSDNTIFHWNMWNKHNGNDPGTRSYRVTQHIDGLQTQSFLVKGFCRAKNYEKLVGALELYKTQLEAFKIYIEDEGNRSALESEGSLDIADNGLELYTMLLEDDEMEKCLPADIPIPDDGLIEDVFVSEVIDGDTIGCRKDGEYFRVRVAGINTPDKGPAGYSASCTETKGSEPNPVWCSKDTYTKSIQALWDMADDKKISLKVDPDDKQDHYGRYIAVLMNKAKQEINLELVKSGYACYFHREDFGDTTLINHGAYINARNAARSAKLGIWAPFELNKNIGAVIFKAYRLKTDGSPTNLTVEVWDESGYLYNTSTTKKQYWETGEQEVIFKLTGYADKKVTFTPVEDSTIIAEATMTKGDEPVENPGYVIFRSYRKSSTGTLVAVTSDVYIDGVFKFRTHASSKRSMSEGLYTATFKHPNYREEETSFGIPAGDTIVVDVTLTELPDDELPGQVDPTGPIGLVDFMSAPSAALIFVEGQYIGTTSKKGYKIGVGTYSATMEKGGYEPCTKSFSVAEDERTPVSCTLIKSYLPPEDPEYPDPPSSTTPPTGYYPTSGGAAPPSGGEYQPMQPSGTPPSGQRKEPPAGGPWEEFLSPVSVLFLNIGEKVKKQDIIIEAAEEFMDKHCDLEFSWESNKHDDVELEETDNGCAKLDDVESLTEQIEPDIVESGTKIVYLLWNADKPECVAYNGFSGSVDDLLFDAILCSSPTSKSDNEFTTGTGKKANIDLKVKYSGTLTILVELCDVLHNIFEQTKSEEADELPEFDKEFCGKNIYKERPNAKCIVEWLQKLNEALPEEVKEQQ